MIVSSWRNLSEGSNSIHGYANRRVCIWSPQSHIRVLAWKVCYFSIPRVFDRWRFAEKATAFGPKRRKNASHGAENNCVWRETVIVLLGTISFFFIFFPGLVSLTTLARGGLTTRKSTRLWMQISSLSY